jgi:hypothetical protein
MFALTLLPIADEDLPISVVNLSYKALLTYVMSRAVAQAVSHRLPTAAARVRAWVKSGGISGGNSGTGAGFLRVLLFSLPLNHSTN